MTIACVVEGHGEVEALPLLIRRIKSMVTPNLSLRLPKPIRVPKTRLQKEDALRNAILLASKRTRERDAILLLMDADADCPATTAPPLLQRAQEVRTDRHISVVLANCEYESWFLAAAESLRGKRGFASDATPPPDSESVRGAKAWMSSHMRTSYRETIDQPAFTAQFDLERARTAPSFDKLYREVEHMLTL